MRCPTCRQAKSKVIDSRLTSAGEVKRRRRQCVCGTKYSTFEVIAAPGGSARASKAFSPGLAMDELHYRSDVLVAIASMLEAMKSQKMTIRRAEIFKRGADIAAKMLRKPRRKSKLATTGGAA